MVRLPVKVFVLLFGLTAVTFAAPVLGSLEWREVNEAAMWAPRAGLESVRLADRLFIMGGRTPLPPPAPPFASIIQRDVWASDDRGESWQYLGDAPWPERAFFEAVTKDGFIFVMGGQTFNLVCPTPDPCLPDELIPESEFHDDVWRSADGIHWDLLTDVPGWAGRAGLSSVVLKGWIYVFAGAQGDDEAIGGSGREFFRDVWKSRNGRDWYKVTDEAPWQGRGGGAAVVKDGRMFLLGGEAGFLVPPFGDVWSSTNGADWQLVAPGAWLPRSGHKCGVINRSIACFGGFNFLGNPMDVQVSADGVTWTALDPSRGGSPPWDAASPEDIKYDFDIVVAGRGARSTILTFGGDRETFEIPPPPGRAGGDDLRVDNDVWRLARGTGSGG